MSHMFWDIGWEKHIFDIVFLQNKGCELLPDLFQKLYAYWNASKGRPRRAVLEMSKEAFFDNAVKSPHNHDFLHTLINPTPTYTKVLVEPDGVEVSEEKFNKLSYIEKCDLVREEVYVMAYERLANRSYRGAYSWMLKQMVLVHAPMYEAMFILKNYYALRNPSINFKDVLDKALNK